MATDEERLRFPPVGRAAYSDRTAWLLATMSRLAYKQFESPKELLDDVSSALAELTDAKAVAARLEEFLAKCAKTPGAELQDLEGALDALEFELVRTFNRGGTQAFLATRPADQMAVLAFRGTEKNFADIKTDLNARFYKRGRTKTHAGFKRAFDHVGGDVQRAVTALSDYKLYVTGHSLGGALAMMAARELSSDGVAACYTFGAPRVGDSEFGDAIKIPIYRVVNAADLVPRVPPTWLIEIVILLARLLPVPYLRQFLIRVLEQFRGYRHHGDMRYLKAHKQPDFSDLRLIANPNLIDRARWWAARVSVDWQAGLGDHRIAQYCDKLKAYALRRL